VVNADYVSVTAIEKRKLGTCVLQNEKLFFFFDDVCSTHMRTNTQKIKSSHK